MHVITGHFACSVNVLIRERKLPGNAYSSLRVTSSSDSLRVL